MKLKTNIILLLGIIGIMLSSCNEYKPTNICQELLFQRKYILYNYGYQQIQQELRYTDTLLIKCHCDTFGMGKNK